jgi:prevent-host-death family protein
MDDKIAISKFKATCLELLEKVSQTGNPLTVTKNGKPIALVLPAPAERGENSAFGCMSDDLKINADITQPLEADIWEVLSE